ncbi:hypothetical protein GYH30_018773, partial [Glycine max]
MLMRLRAFKLSFKAINKQNPTLSILWHPFSSAALADSNTPFTPPSSFSTFDVLQTLHHLHNNPSHALSFFTHLHHTGFSHTISTYAAIIKILSFWNLQRQLDTLFLHLINHDHPPLPFPLLNLFETLFQDFNTSQKNNYFLLRAFNGFVKTCVSLNMFDKAIDFLFQIRRRGILPDVLTCNFLFNRLVEHG